MGGRECVIVCVYVADDGNVIVCITFGPTWFTAAVYVTLSKTYVYSFFFVFG